MKTCLFFAVVFFVAFAAYGDRVKISSHTGHKGIVPEQPVTVRDCPGEKPRASLEAVYVEGCVEEPCNFLKNRTVSMEMDIVFKEPVTKFEPRLYAVIGGIKIRWDGVNPEGCQDIVSDGKCPLKANDYITYGVDLFIHPSYPTITTDVRYEVLDDKGQLQICWLVRASVKAA